MGIIYHEFLLIATCEKTNFVHAIPMQNRQTETILSPFELVFARKPQQLTSFELPKLTSFPVEYREFFRLLLDRAKMYRDMELEWRTLQALELRDKNKMLTNIETFQPNDLVYLLAPYSSSLQSKAQKFRQDYIGPLAIDTKLYNTHYLLKDVMGRTLPGDYYIN